eukprot:CAMPEP_0180412508 /NCGR_PEP_ID=MMETSP0989-20121125/44578_1 /TAXON_ID=697907 /ORGANISM="non described non described, Strain CCMP2293" /LENGTH=109 /DNA_ID=CAMNT_0022416979 /DNA_START=30 /DNA_END=356 /DNA_ORIENTATION=+
MGFGGMSGKAGKGAAGRGKSKGGKSVSRSKKAGLQFPVGRVPLQEGWPPVPGRPCPAPRRLASSSRSAVSRSKKAGLQFPVGRVPLQEGWPPVPGRPCAPLPQAGQVRV